MSDSPLTNEERVIKAIGNVARDVDIKIDSTFEELNVDSLAAIEILFEVEEEFDIGTPPVVIPDPVPGQVVQRQARLPRGALPRGEPAATTLGSGLLENAVVQMMLDKQQGVFRRSL